MCEKRNSYHKYYNMNCDKLLNPLQWMKLYISCNLVQFRDKIVFPQFAAIFFKECLFYRRVKLKKGIKLFW